MIKNESNLRDLQLKQLEILKEFIRVCNELNLKYFLDSGTLLGCIRHDGFIPWDDDIDVGMPRNDYEIFIEKAQSILKEKYFLQHYKTDKEYTQQFAKIRDSETTFIESSVKNLNINHGIYIDIFPLDGYDPEKKISNFINSKKYALYNMQIEKKYVHSFKNKSLKIKIIAIISNILYGRKTITEILEKKDKMAQKNKYSDSKYICSYSCDVPPPSQHYMLRKFYEEGTVKFFEGIPVNVPENYDEVLKRIYGDYMKLPPEEKRIAHHYNEVIDLEKSYKEYI